MIRLLCILVMCLIPLTAAAFPDTSILDNFNRANEDPVSGGGNWSGPVTSGINNMKVVSNGLMQSTSVPSQSGDSYWSAANFGPGAQVYITVPTMWANNSSDIWVFCHSSNEPNTNSYQLYISRSSGSWVWQLYREDNGVATQLGANLGSQTIASGDAIGLDCPSTNALQAWYHATGASTWSAVGTSRTDSTYTSGHIGVGKGFVDTTSVLDDFGGGTIHVDSGCNRLLAEDGASFILAENNDFLVTESSTCGAATVVPVRMLMGVGL